MITGRSVTCPACGGALDIKAAGYSVSIGCQYCGALLDIAHPDVTVIQQYENAAHNLLIPLGSRGSLFDTEWEVIGALQRSDSDISWTEYLLFNPYAGYRWLILSEGQWQFGKMIYDHPAEQDGGVRWQDEIYSLDYDPVTVVTDHVIGEFYWRARVGDRVTGATYNHNRDMLSVEYSADEISWTHLVPVPESTVQQNFSFRSKPVTDAFGKKTPIGLAGSVGEVDYDSLQYVSLSNSAYTPIDIADIAKMIGIACVTLCLAFFAIPFISGNEAAVTSQTQVTVDGSEKTMTVGTVVIDRDYQAVTIDAHTSHFENSWIDIDYMLVNKATQKGHTAYGVVEYYTGSDSEGRWSEGSHNTKIQFSAIPHGAYDVVADIKANSWNNNMPVSYDAWGAPITNSGNEEIAIEVKARAGGAIWSNILIMFMLIFAPPLFILYWRYRNSKMVESE